MLLTVYFICLSYVEEPYFLVSPYLSTLYVPSTRYKNWLICSIRFKRDRVGTHPKLSLFVRLSISCLSLHVSFNLSFIARCFFLFFIIVFLSHFSCSSSLYLFTSISFVSQSLNVFFFLSVCLFLLVLCLTVSLSVCASICLSIPPSPSLCLSAFPDAKRAT